MMIRPPRELRRWVPLPFTDRQIALLKLNRGRHPAWWKWHPPRHVGHGRAQLLLCSVPAVITRYLFLLASARVRVLTRALALVLALALTPLTLNALAFGPALYSLARKFLFRGLDHRILRW
jgi:hypothetical protein